MRNFEHDELHLYLQIAILVFFISLDVYLFRLSF